MTWEQIRQQYPAQWVLMEALKVHTENGRRIFEQLSVLNTCTANADVFPRYKELKRQFPQKEIIFYHASRPVMDVAVRYRVGTLSRYNPVAFSL